MKVAQFNELLKANNAIKLNEDYIVFNDYELYCFKTEKGKKYKTVEELVEDNEFVKEIIENTDEFVLENGGGRGSSSSSNSGKKMGFGNAKGRKGNIREVLLNAELNLNVAEGNSVKAVLDRFKQKYGNADREYAIAVDENGYTYQHIKGGKHSVGIEGDKGQTVIHNHPNGSNFSMADLDNVATTKAKGVVAMSSAKGVNSVYTFQKNDNFKAKAFIKALHKANWDESKGYNKGADEWLKKNQKAYGYKYKHTGNFAKF